MTSIGKLLKSVRKLRPYRYPQWARPLQRFVEHFRSIKQYGRAAEAQMLAILIRASSKEEALLLEDDELVDLLRGRRDTAYTLKELEEVAQFCDELLEAGRTDARIYHIRGWLAARLEGPERAEPYFLKAVERDPLYPFPLLALASIAKLKGEESAGIQYLAKACQLPKTQISCFREYGEFLEKNGQLKEALDLYQRGISIHPIQTTTLEVEEYFGCLAALARIFPKIYGPKQSDKLLKKLLDKTAEPELVSRFGLRFCERHRTLIKLLRRGLKNFVLEVSEQLDKEQREAQSLEGDD